MITLKIADRRAELIGIDGRMLRCHLRIYQHDAGPTAVVVVSEIPGNPGASVTNAAELIASQVLSLYRLKPEHAIFFEHYPPAPAHRRWISSRRSQDTFDRIAFDELERPLWPGPAYGLLNLLVANPIWRASSREEVEALIGQRLEDLP